MNDDVRYLQDITSDASFEDHEGGGVVATVRWVMRMTNGEEVVKEQRLRRVFATREEAEQVISDAGALALSRLGMDLGLPAQDVVPEDEP